MAYIYDDLYDFYAKEKSVSFLEKQMEIYEELSLSNPRKYVPELIRVLDKFPDDNDRIANRKRIIDLYENLCDTLHETYLPNTTELVFDILSQGATKDEKEVALQLEIAEELVKNNPQEYEPKMGEVFYQIASMYQIQKDYQNAENAHKKSLDIYQQLCKLDSLKYEPNIVQAFSRLGYFYWAKSDLQSAEHAFQEEFKIYQNRCQNTPDSKNGFAYGIEDLGRFYIQTKMYEQAEMTYKKGLEIYEKNLKTEFYPNSRIKINILLGRLYLEKEEFKMAESYLNNALKINRNNTQKNLQKLKECEILNEFANLYQREKEYSKAENRRKKSLRITEFMNQSYYRHPSDHNQYVYIHIQNLISISSFYQDWYKISHNEKYKKRAIQYLDKAQELLNLESENSLKSQYKEKIIQIRTSLETAK